MRRSLALLIAALLCSALLAVWLGLRQVGTSLEHWSYIFTILGFPAIVAAVCFEIWKTGEDRDRETQLELSRRYGEFLQLALTHPELELADFLETDKVKAVLEGNLQHQRTIALQGLVSLFEDAYYLFNEKHGALRKQAWKGWEDYIAYWMRRPDFRSAWELHFSAPQYNTLFMAYMNRRWPSSQAPQGVQPDGPAST